MLTSYAFSISRAHLSAPALLYHLPWLLFFLFFTYLPFSSCHLDGFSDVPIRCRRWLLSCYLVVLVQRYKSSIALDTMTLSLRKYIQIANTFFFLAVWNVAVRMSLATMAIAYGTTVEKQHCSFFLISTWFCDGLSGKLQGFRSKDSRECKVLPFPGITLQIPNYALKASEIATRL